MNTITKTNYFGRLGYEHKDDNDWSKFEDILIALDGIVKEGKIRYIGISNETAWGLSNFLEVSKLKDLPKMMCVQNPYNLLNRSYEVGLAEISIREKIGLLGYSPMAGGYLSGKYRNHQIPKNSRIERDGNFWTRYQKPNTNEAVEKYYEISKKYNLDFAKMSLKFCEIQPFMTSTIIGAISFF